MDRCACRIAFNIPGFVLFPVFLIETQFTLPIHLIKKNKILSISGNLILSLWLTKLEFTTQATSFLSSLIPYFPNGQKTRCHQFVHTYLQYKAHHTYQQQLSEFYLKYSLTKKAQEERGFTTLD